METSFAGLVRAENFRLMDALHHLSDSLDRAEPARTGKIMGSLLRRLGLHVRLMEEELCPVLERAAGEELSVVDVLMREHKYERGAIEELRALLEAPVNEASRAKGKSCIGHLRDHVWREDKILLPIAEQLLRGLNAAELRERLVSLLRPGTSAPATDASRARTPTTAS
jgi:DUF438 domain-containing protein